MSARRLFLVFALVIAGPLPAFAQEGAAARADPTRAEDFLERGKFRLDQKQYDAAIVDFTEAVRLDPGNAGARRDRGLLQSARGEQDGALADLDEAIRLDPTYAGAREARGGLWSRKKEYGKALADYAEAVRLDPSNGQAHLGLAWILATAADDRVRDGKRAVESATRGCELDGWKSSNAVGTLAAASAEAGDFAAAVKWQEKSIELLEKPDEAALAPYRARLDLYRAGKPHRQP